MTANMTSDDLDAAWDDIVLLEERSAVRGFEKGVDLRERKFCCEGFRLGLIKGAELGGEIGQYMGFAEAHLAESGEGKSEKAVKALEKLRTSCEKFPRENVNDESMLQALQDVRAKYKLCKALLKSNKGSVAKEDSEGKDMSW